MSESSGATITYLMQVLGSADAMRQLRAVSDHMRQLGDESAQSSAKIESTWVTVRQLATEIGTSANQFNSAIKSASNLYFQYDSLEKVALRVDKAERGLTSARANLIGAQNALNELVGKGIESGPQYEEAQLRVQAAQDALRIKTEELGMAQENLSEAQFKFALSVIPTSVSAVSSFAGGVKTLQGSMLVAKLSSIDLSGAIYGIDANDSAFMRYPTLAHSGVTISDAGASQQDSVGYFVGPWNFRDSIKKSDGFANRLYGRGGTQLHLDADSFADNAAIECYSADRAVQFIPSLIRVNTISLLLSRIGTLAQDIQGQVVLDDGGPAGDVVGTFTVFRDLVGTSATAVNRINVNIAGGGRIQVDKKHWIVLKKQGDSSNHFRWHHDNGTSGVNAYSNGSWTVQENSYALAHRTYSSSRVLVECSSPVSIGKYGVVEAVVDAPWIIERQAMDQYLAGILQYSALQRRLYDVKEVWAPTTLLKAGTLVRLKDGKSGVDADAEVLLARYRFSAGENGLGTRKAEVQLQAFVV